jgi:type II secretory pathway component PulK
MVCFILNEPDFRIRPGTGRTGGPGRGGPSRAFGLFAVSGRRRAPAACRHDRGSVLIIVLWIAFGLVSMTLYFGQSMLFEYRAADQNSAGVQAEQAIEGAARYLSYALTNSASLGHMPDTNYFRFEAVPVGEAAFWFIGREDTDVSRDVPYYGLVDEASKLNLNTATIDMLEMLPRMTPELAAAIIDWRDTDSTITVNGAESETYARLDPPYLCKNAPFDSIEELRMVRGADMDLLLGEDTNMNGALDPNENDGNTSPPDDNRDGKLEPGLFEYLTVYSREPNTGTNSNGIARIDVSQAGSTNLTARLQELFGQERATQIQSRLIATTGFRSLLEFYLRSGMTPQEFGQISDDLSVTNTAFTAGLVNVNTASAAVLACIPGIGLDKATQVVGYRRSNQSALTSVAWVLQVLDQASALQAAPYITTRSYQFSADVVALGPHGRGYRRTLFIFDTSEGDPKIIYRRDRSRLGWALGADRLESWLERKELQ